jgi:hypothetical protein
MLRRVVVAVVDAHDDGEILVLRGRADDDLLGAGREVPLGLGSVGEEAGAFEHNVHAEALPRELLRIFDGEDLDVLAADGQGLLLVADGRRAERAVDAVVDGDDLHFRHLPLDESPKDAPPDSPEAVDTDLDCHDTHTSPCSALLARRLLELPVRARPTARWDARKWPDRTVAMWLGQAGTQGIQRGNLWGLPTGGGPSDRLRRPANLAHLSASPS